MFALFANHPRSLGRTESVNDIPIDAQNMGDYKSGWLCFNWAFFTQYYLSKLPLKHFSLEWSSVCRINTTDEPGKLDFIHSWITLKGCGGELIHLDPWRLNKIAAFSTAEHGYIRNFVGDVGQPLGAYKGVYNGVSVEKTNEWIRWPDWIIKGRYGIYAEW